MGLAAARGGRADRDPLLRSPDRDPDRGRVAATRASPFAPSAVADSLLNIPPDGVDLATWRKPFSIEQSRGRCRRPTWRWPAGELAGVLRRRPPAERPGRCRVALLRGPPAASAPARRARVVRRSGSSTGRSRLPAEDRARSVPDARNFHVDAAQHRHRGRPTARCPGSRQPRLPRHRVRRPAVHDRGHLRDVGRDRASRPRRAAG